MSDDDVPTRPPPPSADALDASVRLARLRQQMFAKEQTARIAEYHVLRPLGGGGMGLVFAAWDPSLDRVVAIKVLRDPWSPSSGDALRREAVALARLGHPNVVSVFEVGEHQGQVYLAMEHVEGQTLRAWTRAWRDAPKPDFDALVDVFVQAAEGLAAAHAAGLVHRDVKPENVMIDEHGRVRVMDFGLARRDDAAAATNHGAGAPTPSGAVTATDGRTWMGTPAYMAPEQFDGAAPGPAADQFALCACLFEVLYGRRARPGQMDAAAAVADTPIELPTDRRIPRRVVAVVRRGLALSPEQRWPHMAAVADALRHTRRSGWGRGAMIAGVVIATVGVASGWIVAQRDDAACSGGPALVDPAWDGARATAIAERLDDGAPAFAAEAWQRLVPELDAYRSAWLTAHRETCEAAQVRREISAEQLDLRMACLDDRRRALGAFVDVIEDGGADMLALAEQGATLPGIASCADPRYVARQGYAAEPTEATRATDERLSRARALHAAGDPAGARAEAEAALAEAEARGQTAAVARARFALGKAQVGLLEATSAHASLVTAYEEARRERLDEVATQAAIELTWLCGVHLSRFDEGLWWLRLAELDGAELADPQISIARDLAAAALLDAAGRSREALARAEAARDSLRDTVGTTDRAFASAQLEVGQLMLLTGDTEGAAPVVTEAARLLADAVGPEHPANARAERILAHVARMRGKVTTAIAHAERALAMTEAALGPDHIAIAPYLESLASGLSQAGRRPEAIAALDRAIALRRPRPLHDVALARLHGRRGDVFTAVDPRAALAAHERAWTLSRAAVGEQHRATVRYLVSKGTSLGVLGRGDEAIDAIRTALVIGSAILDGEHPEIAMMHHALAIEYERRGEHERALEHHRAMLEMLQSLHGPDAYPLAGAHNNVCTGLIRLERAAEAVPHCRRALTIAESVVGESPAFAAELHNTLGGALAMLERNDEAIAEFTAARVGWQQANGPRSVAESSPVYNLGEVAANAGDCAGALRWFREALAIRQEHLAADAPELAGPRAGIERCERVLSAAAAARAGR